MAGIMLACSQLISDECLQASLTKYFWYRQKTHLLNILRRYLLDFPTSQLSYFLYQVKKVPAALSEFIAFFFMSNKVREHIVA